VEVREGGDGDGCAGRDKREVGREHLALQVAEHVPRQVPTKNEIPTSPQNKVALRLSCSMNRWIFWIRLSFPSSGFLVLRLDWGKLKRREEKDGVFRAGSLLT